MYIKWGWGGGTGTVEKTDGLTDFKLQSSSNSKLRISHKIMNNSFYKVKSIVINC